MACVLWNKATTTKGLRHITMRENASRESVHNNTIRIDHIGGKLNSSDLFTKEFAKDPDQFQALRGASMSLLPTVSTPLKFSLQPVAAAARTNVCSSSYNSYPFLYSPPVQSPYSSSPPFLYPTPNILNNHSNVIPRPFSRSTGGCYVQSYVRYYPTYARTRAHLTSYLPNTYSLI